MPKTKSAPPAVPASIALRIGGPAYEAVREVMRANSLAPREAVQTMILQWIEQRPPSPARQRVAKAKASRTAVEGAAK